MATMMSTVDAFQPDVIVLARYMQIIPKAMCDKYSGKIINKCKRYCTGRLIIQLRTSWSKCHLKIKLD
jgi:hypothetical protein